jgi:hypothetical protein
MTPETIPPADPAADIIIVKLHPDSPLAKAADADLTANAQLMKTTKPNLLASLIQKTLGPAFTVRAA